MSFQIDDLEIISKHLQSVFWTHDKELWFKGIALEEKGKGICDRLSQFKKGQIVEVEGSTDNYSIVEGIFEIIEITIPPPDVSKAPAIFRFSGRLKPVY